MALAFFAFKYFYNTPKLSDNAKSAWLKVCGDNTKCKAGVETHYLSCATSTSFEKPENKSDLAEYLTLTRIEIEACLSEKIGNVFPTK